MTGLHERGLRRGRIHPQRLSRAHVIGLVVDDDLDRPLELDLGERHAGKRLLPVHRIANGHGGDRRDGERGEKARGDQTHSSHDWQGSRFVGSTLNS